jgi:dephospho-CoA kinase
MPDGSLNREKMREYAFNHRPALTLLESITHPLIKEASHKAVENALKRNPPYLIFHDPPFFSNRTTGKVKFNKIIVVDCSVENQIQRVVLQE